VIIITHCKLEGHKTPAFYDCDKTKAKLLGSHLKQWNLLEKAVIVSICGKRQSDTAIYDPLEGD